MPSGGIKFIASCFSIACKSLDNEFDLDGGVSIHSPPDCTIAIG